MGLTVRTILMTVLVISVRMEGSAWMGSIPTIASVLQSGPVSVVFLIQIKAGNPITCESARLNTNLKIFYCETSDLIKQISLIKLLFMWNNNVCRDQLNESIFKFQFSASSSYPFYFPGAILNIRCVCANRLVCHG